MSAVTITDQYNLVATQHETQRKVFKNPRGLGYYYALFAYDTVGGSLELRMYKSADGITWSLDSTIYVTPANYIIGSSSLCFVDDGSKTVIHVVFSSMRWDGMLSKYHSYVLYRRGVVTDGSHVIAWDSAAYQILYVWGEPSPVVTRDANGYIYVAYRRYGVQTQSESKYVDGRPSMVRDEWGATGVSPYIDAIDASIISTAVRDAEMGEFSFGDPSILGEQRYVDVYCSSSDANDYIEVYVSGDNGASFALAGEVHPGVAIGWLSVDASAILNTGAKMLAAEVYFIKKTSGAQGSVVINACKLRVIYLGVTDGWGVEMIASTVTDNPTSVQWSSPEVIQESGVPNSSPYWTAYPTIVPFKSGASRDVLVIVKYYDTVRVATTLMACEYSWDGATFTRGIDEIWKSTSPDHLLSAVVDSSNIVYVAMKDYFLELYTRRWQLGVGWMVLGSSVVTISFPLTLSICIDETASPNLIYFFYVATSYGSATNKVTIRTKNTANWNSPAALVGHYADDSEDIRLFSATDVDNNGYMGLVYTRQPAKPTYAVRFFMYPAPPPPVVPGKPLISPPHITEPQVARPLIRLLKHACTLKL